MIYERIDEPEFIRLVKGDSYSSLQHASDEGLAAVYDYLNESGEDVEFDGVAIRSEFSWHDYEDLLLSDYSDMVAEELEEANSEDLSAYSNQELRPIFERVISNDGSATLIHIDDEGAIISE